MNENEVLAKIQAMPGRHDAVVLARFWLQMASHPATLPFTFQDLRGLGSDGRMLFHAILAAYAKGQFHEVSLFIAARLAEVMAWRKYGVPRALTAHAGSYSPGRFVVSHQRHATKSVFAEGAPS